MRRLQLIAAAVHLLAFFACLYLALTSSADALYQAVWFPLFWADLPATVLMIGTWMVIPETAARGIDASMQAITEMHPFSSFWNFWFPALLYGVVGTLWWYYVPRLVIWGSRLFRRRRSATERSK